MAEPKLYDPSMYQQVGMPIPREVIKKSGGCGIMAPFETNNCKLKMELRRALRVKDEQQFIQRFKWKNLPSGLTGQMLERILYYRYSACFFYMPSNGKYYFLPYSLNGTIDCYARYLGVTPLAFAGGNSDKDREFVNGLKRIPVYDLEDRTDDDKEIKCVLLNDYTNQIAQLSTPRVTLQESLIDLMSDCLPYARTALLNSTGINGIRVNVEDEYSNIEAASRAINDAALNGKKWVPILGQMDFQDLTGTNVSNADQFLMTMESVDNLRLSLLGIDNGGLYRKQAQMNNAEMSLNTGNSDYVILDSLENRKRFCEFINAIWGLNVSVELNGQGDETMNLSEDTEDVKEEVVEDDM